MTNHWNDIANSDRVLVIGANPAENHPVSFKHVTAAIVNNGAKLIVVDPRFTRSAAKAHVYAPLRSGTDIAFVNGMINHVITNQLCNEDYVLWYANAGFVMRNDFQGPGALDGLFSGFISNPGASPQSYSKTTWGYAVDGTGKAVDIAKDFWNATTGACTCGAPGCTQTRAAMTLDGATGLAARRAHLTDPAGDGSLPSKLPANAGLTAWEELKAHMARYTPAKVSAITGCPVSDFTAVCDEYGASGASDKSGVIMYAMGTTQHSVGTQNIRAYSVLQILLGNMGVAGGGIAAMRGESNVQGSTDWGLLYHLIPAYLKVPDATIAGDATVGGYFTRTTPKLAHAAELNWWAWQGNTPKYFTAWLADMWSDLDAPPNNAVPYTDPNGVVFSLPNNIQTVYDRLPKIAGNHSHIAIFEELNKTTGDPPVYNGSIKGLICLGQNPAVGGPNSTMARKGLRNLDWLVVSELWETETAAFWQNNIQGKRLKAGGMAGIKTEVFLLPAAGHMEKEGSISNSSRWTQFRYKAVEPPGGHTLGARHEILILNQLYDRCRAHIPDAQIQNLNMGTHWYGTDDPTADYIDREINGYARVQFSATFGLTTNAYAPGALITSFAYLPKAADSGAASCGSWLFCGMYSGTLSAGGTNKSKLRGTTPGPIKAYPSWSWCWPVNRRIIYNRASVRPRESAPGAGNAGAPWDASHPIMTYNNTNTADGFVAPGGAATSWSGNDVIDGGITTPALGGVKSPIEFGPYIMNNEGHCRLFGGFSMAEGPMPEHYEPLENPFGVPDIAGRGPNPMGHHQLFNPCAKIWRTLAGAPDQVGDLYEYPIICSTYRVTEHWQAGAQTRNLPWLKELVPNVFCEMSQELAAARGITNGSKVRIITPRGKVVCYAMVTDRFKPFNIDGQTVHQIGVVWHFGFKGLAKGHSANLLTPHVGCANTTIPEYKAFRCKLVKVLV